MRAEAAIDGRRGKGRRILVALTGTPSGQRALEEAIEQARRREAHLIGVIARGRIPAYAISVAEVDTERSRGHEFFDAIGRLALDQSAESGIAIELRDEYGPLARVLRRAVAREEGSELLVVVGRPGGWLRSLPLFRAILGLRCSIVIAA